MNPSAMNACNTLNNKSRFFSRQQFYIFTIATVAALGGFLFGYDTGIISGALEFIRQTYPVNTFMQEVIVSSVVLGALLGAILSGRLTDFFGSKNMLLYMAVLFIAGTLLSSLAFNISILILGRLIIGIAIGVTSYIAHYSSQKWHLQNIVARWFC